MANVIFKQGEEKKYLDLETKSNQTIYFLTDVQELRRGEQLFGTGRVATRDRPGLMSTVDKQTLDQLASGGTLDGLTAIDKSVLIQDTEDGGKLIGVQLSPVQSNGLFIGEDGVGLQLASTENSGAMSAEDKQVLESLPTVYEHREYEIVGCPEGVVVDYRDKEIRILCPKETKWEKQNSGANADPNKYYIGLRAYAPDGSIVKFKEDTSENILDETMYEFSGEFAGVDEYGRKYSVTWLPVAKYDEETDAWSYYGAKSVDKFIGWFYSVEWYDASGVMVASDMIRVNLSNEDCHSKIDPYYMYGYAKSTDVSNLQNAVTEMQNSLMWGDM